MNHRRKKLKVLLVSLSLVLGVFVSQPHVRVQAANVATAQPINAPIRDKVGAQGGATNPTGLDYATRVHEGLLGFGILITVGVLGFCCMKLINKKKMKEYEARQE